MSPSKREPAICMMLEVALITFDVVIAGIQFTIYNNLQSRQYIELKFYNKEEVMPKQHSYRTIFFALIFP